MTLSINDTLYQVPLCQASCFICCYAECRHAECRGALFATQGVYESKKVAVSDVFATTMSHVKTQLCRQRTLDDVNQNKQIFSLQLFPPFKKTKNIIFS